MFSEPKLLLLSASIFIFFTLNMYGCASRVSDFEKASKITRILNSWVGHHQSEVIAYWGPPTKIMPDGKGGNIIIYESLKGTWGDRKEESLVGGAHYPTRPRQPGYAATRMFYVNEEGVVYSWKWSGL